MMFDQVLDFFPFAVIVVVARYENRFLKIGRTEIPEEAIGAQGHQIGNVTSKNEYIAFLFKALVEDVFVVLPVVEVQV